MFPDRGINLSTYFTKQCIIIILPWCHVLFFLNSNSFPLIKYRTFNLSACTILFIPGSNLRAMLYYSQITTSNITVRWIHPYQDADLVQSYNVSLRERYYSYSHKASVELQTNYTFESSFTPSFLYYFEITSNVLLSDPEETFTVKTNTINLVVGKKFINFSGHLFFLNLDNDTWRIKAFFCCFLWRFFVCVCFFSNHYLY